MENKQDQTLFHFIDRPNWSVNGTLTKLLASAMPRESPLLLAFGSTARYVKPILAAKSAVRDPQE